MKSAVSKHMMVDTASNLNSFFFLKAKGVAGIGTKNISI